MKIRHVLALGMLGCAGAICATGFPRRIGLTRSEAAVSLPGDLELPNADVVVDRSVVIDALPTRVWEVLDAAFEEDEDGRVLIRQENDCLVIRVPAPGSNVEWEDQVEDYTGTCTFALLPEANDRTRLHLRERHQATESVPAWRLWAGVCAESYSTMSMLRDLKEAAEAL